MMDAAVDVSPQKAYFSPLRGRSVSLETLLSYIYFMNTQIRKSLRLNKIYFWTATIQRAGSIY